jgi:hypothetical protein
MDGLPRHLSRARRRREDASRQRCRKYSTSLHEIISAATGGEIVPATLCRAAAITSALARSYFSKESS